ncbi:YqaJ viral recombinase family nuclease [Entomobacter blattae]|uniref:YqaJ-like viral recombinase domain protein n=1 Tax=Entomobacter blattae TaxID=2762277 RepID=A0A7H1NTT5_9PROT|nr:YqaJ viral recombinase family protein [Entomobacter blattae]QNT79195.1 YqaJ-like viral recombinase domain protein [Entomobacter blattae]
MPNYMLSPYGLWQVKAGNAPAPVVDNERVKWGNFLEEGIAKYIAEENGFTIEKALYYEDAHVQGMGCTPDYLITGGMAESSGPGVLEIKNVDYQVFRDKWKASGEPPLHIMLQLQHQLACTGLGWGIIGALVGGNQRHVYHYDARPRTMAEIRKRIAEFWQSIRENRPPPIDGLETTAGIIETLYERVDDTLDLTGNNELPELCAEKLKLAHERKAREEQEAEITNQIKALLQGHSGAICNGFSIKAVQTKDTPDREALPGEIIKGRKGSTRLNIREFVQ